LKEFEDLLIAKNLERRPIEAPRMAIAGAITDANGRPLFASTQTDLGK